MNGTQKHRFRRMDGHWLKRRTIEYEWNTLIANQAVISLFAEDMDAVASTRTIGFVQMAFVTDRFVEWLRYAPRPYAAGHVCHPLPDGSLPLLNRHEIGMENANSGLNILLTRWTCAEHYLTSEERRVVREHLFRAFAQYSRGYRYKEMLIEVQGEEGHRIAFNAGFHEVNKYEEFCLDHPELTARPCLFGVTRTQAMEHEGTLISHLFVYEAPRYYFTRIQQELLAYTLQGKSDDEIARSLDRKIETIKQWWQSIYDRMETVTPGYLPEMKADTRGREKRRLVLSYVRDHPEELRPIEKVGKRPL